MTILEDQTTIKNLIGLGYPLDQAVEMVIPGADPVYWGRLILRTDDKPKRGHKRSSGSRRHHSKKFNYAAQTLASGYALVELVERVNGTEADDRQA